MNGAASRPGNPWTVQTADGRPALRHELPAVSQQPLATRGSRRRVKKKARRCPPLRAVATGVDSTTGGSVETTSQRRAVSARPPTSSKHGTNDSSFLQNLRNTTLAVCIVSLCLLQLPLFRSKFCCPTHGCRAEVGVLGCAPHLDPLLRALLCGQHWPRERGSAYEVPEYDRTFETGKLTL